MAYETMYKYNKLNQKYILYAQWRIEYIKDSHSNNKVLTSKMCFRNKKQVYIQMLTVKHLIVKFYLHK